MELRDRRALEYLWITGMGASYTQRKQVSSGICFRTSYDQSIRLLPRVAWIGSSALTQISQLSPPI